MKIAVIDLFCGAGGTTTGIERAKMFGKKIAKVIACVNHDAMAIKSHRFNHKGVLHFTEDIRTLNLDRLLKLVEKYRAEGYYIAIWASLECTNFSNAKGGQPRDADSRTLAEHLHRYIEAINPQYVFIENVIEFMSWGPLDENGKPISKDKGVDYLKWKNDICNNHATKYWHNHAILNSADYGAHTSRKRYFGVFAAEGLPIRFPKPTYSKNPNAGLNLFSPIKLKKWKPVKEVLDLQDEGNTIFGRKKDLSPKTLARIYAGLVKYVAGGKESFLAKYYSGDPNQMVSDLNSPSPTLRCKDGNALVTANFDDEDNNPLDENGEHFVDRYRKLTGKKPLKHSKEDKLFLLKYNSTNKDGTHTPPSVDEPCPVIACQNRLGVVKANFLMNYHHSSDVNSMENPCPTLVCRDKLAIVNPTFLTKYHGNGENILGMEDTCSTISTKDRLAKVTISPFLDKQFTGSDNHQSIEQPAGTILVNDKHCLITPKQFIDKPFSQGGQHQSIDAPSGSITTVPKMNLVTPKALSKPFLMATHFNNVGSSLEDPAPVITANRKHNYIVNPSWFGHTMGVDEPACTIIARQDKAPIYLITAPEGKFNIPVYDTDCEEMVLIKKFMAIYNIVDIKMRMLKVSELLKIQGFPEKYILKGNQSQQKKFIGNSVVPLVAELLVKEIYTSLREHLETLKAA